MRYSEFKVFSFVALAIGLLLLRADGAPTNGLARARNLFFHSVTERATPPPTKEPGPGSKDPPSSKPKGPGVGGAGTDLQGSSGPSSRGFVVNPEINGYAIKPSPMGTTGDEWVTKDVFNSESKFLDTLGVRVKDNSMAVFQAWNDLDTTPNKISLRGLILGAWKTQSGKNVEDLRRIHYNSILESDAQSAMDFAYQVMQIDYKQQRILPVSIAGTRLGEQEAFQRLLTESPFGAGPQKMIEEYIEMSNHKVVNFIIDRRGGAYGLDVEFDVGV